MGVVFLCTRAERGEVRVDGSQTVTGLSYIIGNVATPVSEHDADAILAMTAPPCCGQSMPFDGQVKIFGRTSASVAQMAAVPHSVLFAKPRHEEEKAPAAPKVSHRAGKTKWTVLDEDDEHKPEPEPAQAENEIAEDYNNGNVSYP